MTATETAALPARITIVGGGTAGWLAALMLSDLARRKKAACDITVVESSAIGTIGVGEGTTAVFRIMLQHLGLDERTFLAATGATIKYGIRHRDWRRIGHHYDGPIDDPAQVAGPGLDLYAIASGRAVAEAHLFQALIDRAASPFARLNGRDVPAGPFHHAYHFDQARAGAWLRTQARTARVIDAQVTQVAVADGAISALTLDDGQRLTADLFIDCTGFRRAVIGALGPEWIGYGDVLPVNRAMPFWLPHGGEDIAPLTEARALGNGWMWSIPTQERMGCGYVYSDAHTTPEAARAEVEAALGHPIEPRRDIRIDAGRLAAPWLGNCIALGLASSFLEPLEATSIHGTITQLMLLSNLLSGPDRDKAPDRYNATLARQIDDFRDFIRLHYMSERRDTAFWRDVAHSHPQDLRDRVAAWARRPPVPADFTPMPLGLPHIGPELATPVLDGLGLLPRRAAKSLLAANPKRRAELRRTHAALVREYRAAAARCIPHGAFLRGLGRGSVS